MFQWQSLLTARNKNAFFGIFFLFNKFVLRQFVYPQNFHIAREMRHTLAANTLHIVTKILYTNIEHYTNICVGQQSACMLVAEQNAVHALGYYMML